MEARICARDVLEFCFPVRRLVDSINSRLPRGWGDLVRQFALFLLCYQGYQVVRGIADGKEAVAIANAQHVIHLERALGAFFEPGLQQTFLNHQWIIELANWMYLNSHFVVTTTSSRGSTCSATSTSTSCGTCSWWRWDSP